MVQTSKEIDKLKLTLDLDQVTRTTSLLNQNQIQKIWNSTPERFKYTRPAKGGGQWTYIKSSYVRKVLDSVFGFNWSFDVETGLAEAFEVAKLTGGIVVKCVLTVRVKSDGQWVELKKTQFGRAEVKWKKGFSPDDDVAVPKPLDIGNDFKAATSDGLKKCASLLGIGADVYEASEFQEIQIIGSDENKARAKATTKKIDQLKNEIKVEEIDNERSN